MEEEDNDEFEVLCKEHEDSLSSSANNTVIENPQFRQNQPTPEEKKTEDNVDEVNEIDKFLEFLEDSKNLRNEQEPALCSSTPVRPRKPSAQENEAFYEKIVDNVECCSDNSEETRPVSNQSDESRSDQSTILAGDPCPGPSSAQQKLYDENGVELDLSVLDEEDEFFESTVDQVLESILDSDDEDETDELNQTIVPKRPVSDVIIDPSLKAAKPDPSKKLQREEIKNIVNRYYDELVRIYHQYDIEPPRKDKIRQPRIFNDRTNKRRILGYEGIEEFIDNNHPMWNSYREFFKKYLEKERSNRDFSEFVHQKWESTYDIDLNKNLSCFARKNWMNSKERGTREKGSELSEDAVKPEPGNDLVQLQAMYNNTLRTTGLRKKEEKRLKKLKSDKAVNDKGEETEIQTNRDGLETNTNERKRKASEPSSTNKRFKIEEHGEKNYAEIIFEAFAKRNPQNWLDIMKSISEALEFRSCYQKTTPVMSADVTRELLGMESVYDGFKQYYRSPYAKDNPADESTIVEESSNKTLIENY